MKILKQAIEDLKNDRESYIHIFNKYKDKKDSNNSIRINEDMRNRIQGVIMGYDKAIYSIEQTILQNDK